MPDIYRLKYRLWTDFVKRYGRLPPPQVWSQIRAQILTKLASRRAGKEGREEVKQLTPRAVLDKENIPAEPVVFKVPAVTTVESVPRQQRRQTITAPENISPKENISITENISPKENISSSEIIPSHRTTSVGRHLPGSVTVACVTACEKSSNPRQKVAKYFSTYNIKYITLILFGNLRGANGILLVCWLK